MLSLVLSICGAFGPSIADAAPRTWAKFYKAAQSAVAPQEIDWVKFYKNSGDIYYRPYPLDSTASSRIQYAPVFVAPVMQWAVPRNMGGPLLYGPPDRYSPYGGYETPATAPKK